MAVGIALGSGGARGWCHIGVLRGLQEIGVTPDVVAGCSMGALVGAAWAGGRLDALEDWARSLNRASFLRYLDLSLSGGGLVRGKAVSDIMGEIGLPDQIGALQKPFIAVATDLASGREVWLQKGDLKSAVRASIAIPGLFQPYQIDGRWHLDGGLVNPVPTSACRALGAGITIAVNPNAKHGRPLWQPKADDSLWSWLGPPRFTDHLPEAVQQILPTKPAPRNVPDYLEVVSAAMDILTDYLRQTRDAADPPDIRLDADLDHVLALELYRADEAINEGSRIVTEQADEILAICKSAE